MDSGTAALRVSLIRRAAQERPRAGGPLWEHESTALLVGRALRLAASICARDTTLTVTDAVELAAAEVAPGDWSQQQLRQFQLQLLQPGW